MAEERIEVGDRVINLQMPGIFVVVARRGRLLDIRTDDGVTMTVLDSAVRRIEAPSAAPTDA
ncbi:MAG TPA: hypothetical protein VNO26_02090 [Candidatus Limnocylindria bacterium]|nr:hypothetical protein [Candidatus Limnocylindria bacterium]